jgi:ribosomal-protein-alanine N-acetyltransferase
VPVYCQFHPLGYLYCQTPGHHDIAALVALDQRALGGLWSAEGYAREIDSPNSCLLMLVQSPGSQSLQSSQGTAAEPSTPSMVAPDSMIGLGCYWAILEEAHITVLAVDPYYQRRGLGKWLLVNLLADAGERALTRATLEVRPSNSRALARLPSTLLHRWRRCPDSLAKFLKNT